MNKPAVILRNGRLVRSEAAGFAPAPAVALPAVAAAGEPAGKAAKMLIVAFVVALCLPFSAYVGPLRLTPVTLLLLLGFVPLVVVWLFKRPTPVGLPDALLLAFWLWATVAVGYHHGLGASVEQIGMHLLQTVGAFAAGRVLVRNEAAMRCMIRTAAVTLLVAAPFVVVEALTGRPVILQAARLIGPSLPPVNMTPRMGLHRAQAFFEHPILFGVFCASIFSLALFGLASARRPGFRWAGAAAAVVTSVMSLSTGALLALNVQFGLIAWRRIFRNNDQRWKILAAILVLLWVTIDLLSTRTPFHVFVQYATFSSGSSYNRILIWHFGSAEALRHPFFGIGFGEWERPRYMSNSMDNFWLVQAVRYGIPAFLLLFGTVLTILIRMGRRRGPNLAVEQMRRGAAFAIIGTMLAIASVHLWNSTYIWFMFLLGSCVWMTLPVTAGAAPVSPAPPPRPASARARAALKARDRVFR